MKRSIEVHRKRIDLIDRRIARLLTKRFRHILCIGRVKRETDMEVTDAAREHEVLERIGSLVKDEHARRFVCSIYSSVFDESSRVQREEGNWTGR